MTPRSPHQRLIAAAPRGVQRAVIQRSWDPVEREKAKMRERDQKRTDMQQFAQGHAHLYRPAPNWGEQQLVGGLNFGSNRSSASLITSATKDTVYVAEQTGKAYKNPEEVAGLSGAHTVAADEYHERGLHAEMQIIYHLLLEWKQDPVEWGKYGLGTAEAFLKDRIGRGKAVSKGKGCCQRCAAILLKLGVSVGYIEPSKFEKIWVDPFEVAGVKNPWF
ncbi:MAG TPA: hypothetical protein VFM63_05425 [Pyrinomonadaceae bacterium]|nr:hypothetical protein [Pyrinomonadaceae bacterium]